MLDNQGKPYAASHHTKQCLRQTTVPLSCWTTKVNHMQHLTTLSSALIKLPFLSVLLGKPLPYKIHDITVYHSLGHVCIYMLIEGNYMKILFIESQHKSFTRSKPHTDIKPISQSFKIYYIYQCDIICMHP